MYCQERLLAFLLLTQLLPEAPLHYTAGFPSSSQTGAKKPAPHLACSLGDASGWRGGGLTEQPVREQVSKWIRAGGKRLVRTIPQRLTPQPVVYQDGCSAITLSNDTSLFPLGKPTSCFLACLRLLNGLIQSTLSAELAEFSSENFIIL